MEFQFVIESNGLSHGSFARTSDDHVAFPSATARQTRHQSATECASTSLAASRNIDALASETRVMRTAQVDPSGSFGWPGKTQHYQLDAQHYQGHGPDHSQQDASSSAQQSYVSERSTTSSQARTQRTLAAPTFASNRHSVALQHTPPSSDGGNISRATEPSPSTVQPASAGSSTIGFRTPPPDHSLQPQRDLIATSPSARQSQSHTALVSMPAALLPSRAEYFPIYNLLVHYSRCVTGADDLLKKQLVYAEQNLHDVVIRILAHKSNGIQQTTSSYSQSSFLVRARQHCPGVTGIGGAMVPGTISRHKAPGSYLVFRPRDNTYEMPGRENTNSKSFSHDYKFIIDDSGQSTQTLDSASRAHVVKTMRRKREWEQQRDRLNNGETPVPEARSTRKRLNRQSSESGSSDTSPNSDPKKTCIRPYSASHQDFDIFDNTAFDLNVAIEALQKSGNMPYTVDPTAGPGASMINPFSSAFKDVGNVAGGMLHHFAWVMPSLMDEIVSGSVFNRLGWLYSAVAAYDPSPAHTIIGYTLCHVAKLRGVPEPPQAIEHRQKGQQLIINRARTDDGCLSDDLIGSILNVAGWELIMCNPTEHSIHMGGIRKIVKYRGGVNAFMKTPGLRRELFRMDAIRAYIAISEPRYRSWGAVREMEPIAINVPFRGNFLIPPTKEGDFCAEALQLIHELEIVLQLINSISDTIKSQASINADASWERALENRGFIENNLADCLKAELAPCAHPLPYQKCLRLAALVFVDGAIEHFFDGDRPDSGRRRLEAIFIQSLNDRAMMTSWGRSLQMVLHVLLSADPFMLEKPWRSFYFADALLISMAVSGRSWKMIQTKLEKYLQERINKVKTQKQRGELSDAVWDLKTNYERLKDDWSEWERRSKDSQTELIALYHWGDNETRRGGRKAGSKALQPGRGRKKVSSTG